MNHKLPRIAITHGDPNGVGYEIILKALDDNRLLEICTPVIYGSQKILHQYAKELDLPLPQLHRINNASQIADGQFCIFNVTDEDFKAQPGASSAKAGELAFVALEKAVDDLRNGDVDALVTAPICKSSIQSDDFHFAGHTEYLCMKDNEDADQEVTPSEALMILCNDRLRVALATTHMPLAEIPTAISHQLIADKLIVFNKSLHADFGINTPRIAVLALNPHAGDDGLLGSEEKDIIKPAIDEVREKNKILAFGPYAADGFFGSGAYEKFDGVLAMYHDQGLAPFKTIAMDAGVNVTAGLSFVRTSPDHGTGFDIAGKGVASAESLRQAIYSAIDILRNRRREAIAHRNPLRRQYHDKGNDNVVLDLS